MRVVLTIDIGNTNITAGIFRNGHIAGKIKLPTADRLNYAGGIGRLIKRAGLDMEDVGEIVISSVVPSALSLVLGRLRRVARCRISVTGKDVTVPVKNLYRNRGEVGQDRLVNAYAAGELYGAPAVVIDFGTAITFDIVSRSGAYLGGLILPGIDMGLSSLYERTALLPRVELKRAVSIVGKDTKSSMRGGILFGYGAMCDGLVSSYRRKLGRDTKVIATGGNAKLIRRYTKSIRVVDDDLTLKGLYLIATRHP
ncbi:MAG: type III pantothenate kinase [Candidatus Omnitrophota bacterium]